MKTHFTSVCEFMNMCAQEVVEVPTLPSEKIQVLRYELVNEEVNELRDAVAANDIIEVADALTDILYVAYGAYAAYGLTPTYPTDYVREWNALHTPNLHAVTTSTINAYNAAIDELRSSDLHNIKTALDIIIRHTYDIAYTCNINVFACFTEVHSSNMSKACITKKDAQLSIKSKVDANTEKSKEYADAIIVKVGDLFVIKRKSDMKVLKGNDYFDPDLKKILNV